jgi:uncharacterized protein
MRTGNRIPQSEGVAGFFALVVALSVPFWLIGGRRLPLPLRLPASALMFVAPAAASILAYRDEGGRGLGKLWRRVVDYRRIRSTIWYVPIVLLLPGIYAVSYGLMRLMGRPLPEPNIPLRTLPVLVVVFFLTAVGEEVGYMGYATDRMQRRWGALTTALLLGVVWGSLHVIPDVQNGRGAAWILSQRAVHSVALRVLIGWIYNNTGGSVFAAALFHGMDNVSVSLFPNDGSHYDPAVTGMITAVTAAVVTFLWRPKTLAAYRSSGRRGVDGGEDVIDR